MSINANMSILDGMRKIIPEESIFITVGNASFNMSKTAYELLGNPTGLEIYIGSGKVAFNREMTSNSPGIRREPCIESTEQRSLDE